MDIYDKSGIYITVTVSEQTQVPVGTLLEQLLLEQVRRLP